MTGNYTTEIFDKQHRHFGGSICLSDFNTCRGKDTPKGSTIASHIESDFKWEKKLLKNIKK